MATVMRVAKPGTRPDVSQTATFSRVKVATPARGIRIRFEDVQMQRLCVGFELWLSNEWFDLALAVGERRGLQCSFFEINNGER